MRPWRPAELFRQSFTPVPGHEEPVGREAERFREHFESEAGIVKSGPWYALRRWFDPVLPGLVTFDDMEPLGLSGYCVRSAQIEALRRLDYMVVRNPQADSVSRQVAALNGFTVEKHVKEHFRSRWPDYYRPASNEGVYRRAAPDDFSLWIGGQWITIDVASSKRKYPPEWTLQPGKLRGASIRIFAYYNEHYVWMQGFTKGDNAQLYPIERMIVRLNIQKMGIESYFPAKQRSGAYSEMAMPSHSRRERAA